jgi:hypothetical protein
VRRLDVGFELPALSLNGANPSQPLDVENDLVLEISPFLNLVVIELLLQIVIMREISAGGSSE